MQTEHEITDDRPVGDEDEASVVADAEAAFEAEDAAEDAVDAADGAAESPNHVCPVGFCPIGMALSSMERSGPDALEHLLAAGREVLLAAKIHCAEPISASELVQLINDFEARLRALRPEVRWIFIEPDIGPSAEHAADVLRANILAPRAHA